MAQQRYPAKIAALFFLGMVVVCVDVVNVDLGGFKLKIAYVAFALYMTLFAYWFGLSVNRRNLAVVLILLLGFAPSVMLTTSPITSVAFYAGTIMCAVILMTFAKMTSILADGVYDVLKYFYRFTIILSTVFVLTGYQDRGHFLLYEASYYAIALIPYVCIVFGDLFSKGLRNSFMDVSFIIVAIIISASVSLVIWTLLSFIVTYARSGKVKLGYVFSVFAVATALLFLAFLYNTRAQSIGEKIGSVFQDPAGWLDLLMFVAGNRVQRVLIAYEAFITNPWFGVGLGALKSYATANFNSGMFEIDGASADDFTADLNATNVYLELAAEGGLVALGVFLYLLYYVSRHASKKLASKPLQIAFFVTMISLLIESSYLRTYVWAMYGILLGLSTTRKMHSVSDNGSPSICS